MTEEEELMEAFPEEFEEQSDEPTLEDRVEYLERRIKELQGKVEIFTPGNIDLIKQAIAQIVIAGGESKDG